MNTAIILTKTKAYFTPAKIIDVVAFLYLALFITTGINKLTDPGTFWGTLNGSQLVKPYANFLTYSIPILELLICVLLIVETPIGKRKIPARKLALIAGGALMLSFTIYIVLMFALYGNDLPCSCGGVISMLSWGWHLVLNLVFVGLAVWAVMQFKKLT